MNEKKMVMGLLMFLLVLSASALDVDDNNEEYRLESGSFLYETITLYTLRDFTYEMTGNLEEALFVNEDKIEKTETLTNVPITIIGNEDSSRYTGYLIINYADKEEKFHFDIFVGVIDEDEPTVLNNSKILSGTNRSKVILFDREKEEEESSVIILEIILILIILVIIAFIIHKFAGYKIHEQQIKRLLDIAHRHLEEKKPHHARKTYEKIQHRYKKAPKKVKKKVFKHSHKLHTKIVEHEKKISAKDISTKRSHKGKQR